MNPTNQSDTQRVHQMLLDVQARIQGFRYAQQLVAPQLAPAFSLMDYLRGNERAISEYLGMLLDTQGPHGQGDLFWRPFAELLCTTQGQARWVRNSKRRKITLEKITDDGRFLDIHIQSDGGCIAIENKPWAQDQELQLADYANYMERASGGQPWLLIYLSDRAPSESSIDIPKRKQHEGAGQFMQLNWTQVLDWLRACSPHVQAPKVRLFVESLSDYIRRHIKYEQEEAVMSQVLQVISTTPQSVETAMGIAQSIPELQKVLLRQLHDSLRGACDEKTSGFNGMRACYHLRPRRALNWLWIWRKVSGCALTGSTSRMPALSICTTGSFCKSAPPASQRRSGQRYSPAWTSGCPEASRKHPSGHGGSG